MDSRYKHPMFQACILLTVVYYFGITNVQSGISLNEIMARNDGAVVNSVGNTPDWIELYNSDSKEANLDGLKLFFDESLTNRWTFPTGIKIGPFSYLIVWCDKNSPASIRPEAQLNCGQPLDSESGLLGILNAQGVVIDSVRYGFQVSNLSIGRINPQWSLMEKPTPGLTNSAELHTSGAYSLSINEWMANPASGDDWFELYNPEEKPVALSALLLIDSTTACSGASQVGRLPP